MYDVERITIEVVSAIACFILTRFMIKPFRLTGETRYLGLPLGFGFLGASYTFSALSYSPILGFDNSGWLQLFFRAFAFLFLAITYYFSKSVKKSKLLWNTTLGALAAIMTILILVAIISPQCVLANYLLAQVYVRIFDLICLSYISIHALKSHIEQPDPTTLMIPLAFILLAIGQYSVLIWVVDKSALAFWTGLAFRLAGLAIFLYVSYRAFHSLEKVE
jgi:fluoride ion exporter CrcB/FEX